MNLQMEKIISMALNLFASLSKMRLYKFRGLSKEKFKCKLNLHLKECEFRFNNRHNNLFKILIENFRKEPLN